MELHKEGKPHKSIAKTNSSKLRAGENVAKPSLKLEGKLKNRIYDQVKYTKKNLNHSLTEFAFSTK